MDPDQLGCRVGFVAVQAAMQGFSGQTHSQKHRPDHILYDINAFFACWPVYLSSSVPGLHFISAVQQPPCILRRRVGHGTSSKRQITGSSHPQTRCSCRQPYHLPRCAGDSISGASTIPTPHPQTTATPPPPDTLPLQPTSCGPAHADSFAMRSLSFKIGFSSLSFARSSAVLPV